MIGRLRGEIVYKHPPRLMLDVGGIGYEIDVPISTFYDLPPVGDQVTLITHLIVREDTQALYGFLHAGDRTLFRNLLKVNGVGARMALVILSGMDAQEFALCVRQEDTAALARLPGIGKKTAQRLVMELRDRVDAESPGSSVGTGSSPPSGDPRDSTLNDAVDALMALGYRPADANRMARAVDDGAMTSEEIIRAALKAVSTP